MRAPKRPIGQVAGWLRRQPPKVKAFLAVVSGMAALVVLRLVVTDHDNLFVGAEAAHAIGIAVLIYKLTKERSCAGSFFFVAVSYLDSLFLVFFFIYFRVISL